MILDFLVEQAKHAIAHENRLPCQWRRALAYFDRSTTPERNLVNKYTLFYKNVEAEIN